MTKEEVAQRVIDHMLSYLPATDEEVQGIKVQVIKEVLIVGARRMFDQIEG